jgi:hypothetical protein
MSISIEKAFSELHNLNVREALRRFQPQLMLVAVDEHDAIIKTEKLKKAPEVDDLHKFGDDCKGTAIFVADTENFPTFDKFRQAVMESGEAIRNRRKGIADDPDTYYGGRMNPTAGDL